jgi:hypothetical protein
VHSENELSPRNSTEAGRQIDINDEQPPSASDSIRVSFDPNAKVNDESDVQSEKELSPRNSTEAGRQIDCSNEQPRKAEPSIRVSFDPDSNINDEINRHS